jgi:hypothetical protein
MKDKLLNCWEKRHCGREKDGVNVLKFGECPTSKMNMGHSCWVVAGSFHGGIPYCPEVKEKKIKCSQCEIFKLYSRTTGTLGTEIRKEFPAEEEKYQKIMIELYKKNRNT